MLIFPIFWKLTTHWWNKLIVSFVVFFLFMSTANSCPEDYISDQWGVACWPKVGGTAGQVSEKTKKEINNAGKDLETWVRTGKCGGDICDAFDAAIKFPTEQINDIGPTLENAGKRLKEGKPLDAVWHIFTDVIKNTSENAADTVNRSAILASTAQIAASAYGGHLGAAAFSAWVTYNRTGGNLGDALKAGIISGISAAALDGTNNLDIEGVRGTISRSVLTASINGAAVAASGGNQEDIRKAMEMGVATVLIRDGYRELTSHDLNSQRLKSSQGPAYCLASVPPPEYFLSGGNNEQSCFAPAEAYSRDAQGRVLDRAGKPIKLVNGVPNGEPKIDIKKLDPNRPHVGIWAKSTEPTILGTQETSSVMTGVSRLPGWNAMAVGHDQFVNDYLTTGLKIDVLSSVATIPPAVALTYLGSGEYIHEMIRENVIKSTATEPIQTPKIGIMRNEETLKLKTKFEMQTQASSIEVLHIVCGAVSKDGSNISKNLDLLIEATIGNTFLRPLSPRKCEVSQLVRGIEYRFWHAHYDRNSCFKKADDVVRRYQKKGLRCFGSTGLRSSEL